MKISKAIWWGLGGWLAYKAFKKSEEAKANADAILEDATKGVQQAVEEAETLGLSNYIAVGCYGCKTQTGCKTCTGK